MMEGNWHYPVEILFGTGKLSELAKSVQHQGFKRPLLVIDPFLLNNSTIQEMLVQLRAEVEALTIFQGIIPNPTGESIEDGVRCFRESQADGVIAIGGGSALDTAKTIALMGKQCRPLWDFIDEGDNYLRANDNIPSIIAIPTTSGTGAEVGRAAVIKNTAEQNKFIIFHPKMQPSLVIADPRLTLSVPKALTAYTALDAFAHCLEAYCAPGYHPMADGIAIEGMRLIAENLEIATADGQNLDARSHLMAAAIMGATAFQKGLGAVHGLSHPVGARYNLSHGLLNALFMPTVLRFNEPKISNKINRLCNYLGLEERSLQALINWLLALYQRLELPKGLAELGALKEDAALIARQALADPSTITNPRALTLADYERLYLSAI